MADRRTLPATPTNAGLLAVQRTLADERARAAQLLAAPGAGGFAGSDAPDLIAATDAISFAFAPGLSAEAAEQLRDVLRTHLGSTWTVAAEEIPPAVDQARVPAVRIYRGAVALPQPEVIPTVGEAWDLARDLAGLDGIATATPLFAQVVPHAQDQRSRLAFALDNDDAGPIDAQERRDWHLTTLRVHQAWALLKNKGIDPGQGVRVAVLDTGYSEHPEILERLYRDPHHPDAVFGPDLLDGDMDPFDPLEGEPPLAFPGHGTSVASVIVSPPGPPAQGPALNDEMTGIAYEARVMPVRTTTSVVLLLPNKITPAIRRAVDEGADVINISLGLPYPWAALQASIQYAIERGVIVVAAAGNYVHFMVYPAQYQEVLAATAGNFRDLAWAWTSEGEPADVMAPGVAVQSAYSKRQPDDSIVFTVRPGTGTTFATACSSGLAALWLSYHGGRERLIQHYQGDARRVPQAFHYLMRATAKPLDKANDHVFLGGAVQRLGDGIPQADRLLQADLPTPQALDGDAWGVANARVPLAIAAGAALAGLDVTRAGVEPELIGLRDQLAGDGSEPLSAELTSELDFHLVSRPDLLQLLRIGRVAEVRETLLNSQHLSTALRRRLRAAPVAQFGGSAPPAQRTPPSPSHRKLRIFALDPSLSTSLRTVAFNRVTLEVPWEPLKPGPVGEYLEVVDVDPASGAVYAPVDLDDPRILASDGLGPDESDPWFHQQMVYGVAMKTIHHFEAALGRPALWATGPQAEDDPREPFVPRLRLYPHALRDQNAYYSADKRALLFGYFRGQPRGGALPGPMVFTCLSYDIIAHETTHALLDGMYRHYLEDTNPDMLAFHEAFADLVALLQHFTHTDLLQAAIEESRADLERNTLLGKLAIQFGQESGTGHALRDAIGTMKGDVWIRQEPDPTRLTLPEYRTSPHLRGTVLVAAVFDAFLKIYARRSRALIRLATGGSGELRPGWLEAHLASALVQEAAKTAGQVLHLIIRALDYLPPVNITFGEYLRALITADRDLVPSDPWGYRVALVESFRAWGIEPEGLQTVTPESLCWHPPQGEAAAFALSTSLCDHLNRLLPAWRANRSRKQLQHGTVLAKHRVKAEIRKNASPALMQQLGIGRQADFEVHTLRAATTLGPDGTVNPMVVVSVLQRQPPHDGLPMIRTGATLIFDRGSGKLRYVIHKRDSDESRAEETAAYQRQREHAHLAQNPLQPQLNLIEPFAALHQRRNWRCVHD